MKRVLEGILALSGIAAAVLLLIPDFRSLRASLPPPPAAAATFHGGKPTPSPPSNGCGGSGCHGTAPHRAGGGMAAFRNLHAGKVECAACHAASPKGLWGAGAGGYAIASRFTPAGDPGRHVGIVRKGLSCRECHSREGEQEIRRAGIAALPASFEAPMALRLMEGGARKW